MELDPGIHIVMHSVLFLKPGVTLGLVQGELVMLPPVRRESREGGVDLLRKEVFQGVFCK
jgi:hypothetical protein